MQRFLTGLQPQTSCQILLRKRPDTLKQAIADAVEVKDAPSFSTSWDECKLSQSAANAVTAVSLDFTASLKLKDILGAISKRWRKLK